MKTDYPYSFNNNRYILELASSYDELGGKYGFYTNDCNKLSFIGSRLKILEEQDYIKVKYSTDDYNAEKHLQVDSMVLTPKGEKLLNELRSEDVLSKIKKYFFIILTSILTSIFTVLFLNWLGSKK